jgi:hypothetical protein
MGAFPEVIADVVLSDNDDDVEPARLSRQNALVDWDASAADDVGGTRTTSVEAIIQSGDDLG